MILTSCGNPTFSPVDCVGPLRARSFVLPHRSNHRESCAVSDTSADTPQTGTHDHASHDFKLFCPSDWARPVVGGGLDAAPCGPSARYRAPDWTELLPRQAIGGRDARAQDFYTQSTNTTTVNEAIGSRGSRVDSVHHDSVHTHTHTVRVDLKTLPLSKHSSSQIFTLLTPAKGERGALCDSCYLLTI